MSDCSPRMIGHPYREPCQPRPRRGRADSGGSVDLALGVLAFLALISDARLWMDVRRHELSWEGALAALVTASATYALKRGLAVANARGNLA